MDFGLSEEQEIIVSTVRSFVEKEIYPHEAEVEKLGYVPQELAAAIKAKVQALGFYAPNFPHEVGGGGLDGVSFALLERELGRASNALTHFWGRPQNILLRCTGEQRQRYLLPAVRGEKSDAIALTEPGAGSDLRGIQCTARREGGDWVLNGTKHFISGAAHADFVIVLAATGEESSPRGKRKTFTCFLADRETPGFDILPGYECVSHRGYPNSTLVFEDCHLSDAHVLGEIDQGFQLVGEWLFASRITVAATCVGRARRVLDYALEWAATRTQFGQKIGKFQGVGFKLADMAISIDGADWLTLNAAWRIDQGLPAEKEIAGAKVYASEMLARVTDEAVQIHGGMGLMSALPLARFWRDARVERIWDGTSEVQRHIIARCLLRPLGG